MKKLNLECKNCHERSRPLAGSRPQLCKSIKTNFFRKARPQRILFISSFAVFFVVFAWFGFPAVAQAATVTAIDPASGTNNGTTSITSVTGTNFKSGWDKENGLVGNWRLDENSGTSTADVSGNSNNGTLTNGPTWTTGKLNSAVNFDGTNDRIAIGSDLIGTGADTISAWIKADSYGGGSFGRIESNGQTLFYVNNIDGANIPGLRFTSNGANNIADSAAGSIQLSTWYHVVATRNSSGVANIYINGVLSGAANQNSGTPGAGTTNVQIGGRTSDDARNFDGLIDEVRVYNRVLTGTEISDLYNATSTNPSVKLRKSGQSDISCTGFSLTSSTTLSSGSCPLNGVATGAWDVQVQNGDSATGTLASGFTVNAAGGTTVTAIDPTSGTNNGTTSITSVTGTNFKSGWDKE